MRNASSGQIQSLAFAIRSLAKAALATHHIRNGIAVGGGNGEKNQSMHKEVVGVLTINIVDRSLQ